MTTEGLERAAVRVRAFQPNVIVRA